MAACAVRDIRTIRCFSPNKEHREAFAAQMTETLGVEVEPVGQPEEAIAGADIAMCSSSSLDAIFFEPWVETGMHMTSIKRPEIEMKALARADRIVIHNNDEKPIHVMTRDLANAEKAKDHGWSSVGDLDFATLPTLPELIVGRAQGRQSDKEITCFLNNIGLGYQFAAAGAVVIRKAKESGLGHELPTDWFTEDVHP
jgi:ornithine cyclodeaminase/alanine dehydrogenase-like protein (mu-crystallin family)